MFGKFDLRCHGMQGWTQLTPSRNLGILSFNRPPTVLGSWAPLYCLHPRPAVTGTLHYVTHLLPVPWLDSQGRYARCKRWVVKTKRFSIVITVCLLMLGALKWKVYESESFYLYLVQVAWLTKEAIAWYYGQQCLQVKIICLKHLCSYCMLTV